MKEIVVVTDEFLYINEKKECHIVPRGSIIQINSIIQYLSSEYNLHFNVIQMAEEEGEYDFGNIRVHAVASNSFDDYKDKIHNLCAGYLVHFNNIDLYDESFSAHCITATIHTNAFLEKENAINWLKRYGINFDKIIVVNKEYMYKYNTNNMVLVHNGIDNNSFCYEEKKPEKSNILLFPNIPAPNKNLDFALKLIRHLNMVSQEKYMLYISGINKRGIKEDNVQFLGSLDHEKDMPLIYRDALVTLIPSFSESCSLCMLESMATGTVVLANNIVGLSDYVVNDKTGFLLSTEDVFAWGQKVLQLSNDSELYHRIAVQACNMIKNKYLLKLTAEKYYQIWREYLI